MVYLGRRASPSGWNRGDFSGYWGHSLPGDYEERGRPAIPEKDYTDTLPFRELVGLAIVRDSRRIELEKALWGVLDTYVKDWECPNCGRKYDPAKELHTCRSTLNGRS